MAEATARPWLVNGDTEVVDTNCRLVANTGGYANNLKSTREENKANAELIVFAVNIVEELVVALAILEKARAVLEKAEAQP